MASNQILDNNFNSKYFNRKGIIKNHKKILSIKIIVAILILPFFLLGCFTTYFYNIYIFIFLNRSIYLFLFAIVFFSCVLKLHASFDEP